MTLIDTLTVEGAAKGMVQARAAHELQDQEVVWLQDAFVNQPGLIQRRGGLTTSGASGFALGNNLDGRAPSAICSVYDPSGSLRIAVLYWKSVGAPAWELWAAVYDQNFTFIQKHYICGASSAFIKSGNPIVLSTAQATDGSVLIYGGEDYTKTANGFLARWWGGCPTTSILNNGSVGGTITTTINSVTATGLAADIAKLNPGTVLVGLGVVRSVDSSTSITLTQPATVTGSTAVIYAFADSLAVARSRGEISCAVASPGTITGYGTKFTEASWNATHEVAGQKLQFVDPIDGTLIATAVTSPTVAAAVNDTVMNANVVKNKSLAAYLYWELDSASGKRWGAVTSQRGRYPQELRGGLSTSYNGWQFFLNEADSIPASAQTAAPGGTSRVRIAGPNNPEVFDHSQADGDWFPVTSTVQNDPDGIAIMSGRNSVVIGKSKETFAVLGSSPDDFHLTKIADDGVLTCEAITRYGGDVIWLGRNGVWRFNGSSAPENIVLNTLGQYWQTIVANLNGQAASWDANGYPTYQARCFVFRDHLFINLVGAAGQFYNDSGSGNRRGSGLTQQQMVIYLPTGAVSFLTNFNFQGYIAGAAPSLQGDGVILFAQDASTSHFAILASSLFKNGNVSVDAFMTQNNTATMVDGVGPWFYMQSRLIAPQDGLLRKAWKQLAFQIRLSSAAKCWISTVSGLSQTITVVPTELVGVTGSGIFGTYKAQKLKFNLRDQYASFLIYEDKANRPTNLILGAWQWGYKLARRGSV